MVPQATKTWGCRTRLAAHSLFSAVLDFIYPPVCILCEKESPDHHTVICTTCLDGLPRLAPALIATDHEFAFDYVLSLFEYDKNVQTIVHWLKYRGLLSLGPFLGELIAQQLLQTPVASMIQSVVPVPLHPVRYREREYNQAELIANPIAFALGLSVDTRLVKRIQYTDPQAKKNVDDRLENVTRVFQVEKNRTIEYECIAVVDDVLTTGETLHACAAALKNSGVQTVVAISLARVMQKRSLWEFI